jgi:hypothetical protein
VIAITIQEIEENQTDPIYRKSLMNGRYISNTKRWFAIINDKLWNEINPSKFLEITCSAYYANMTREAESAFSQICKLTNICL